MRSEVASEDNTEAAYPMHNPANYVQVRGETMIIIRIITIIITNDSSHFSRIMRFRCGRSVIIQGYKNIKVRDINHAGDLLGDPVPYSLPKPAGGLLASLGSVILVGLEKRRRLLRIYLLLFEIRVVRPDLQFPLVRTQGLPVLGRLESSGNGFTPGDFHDTGFIGRFLR